MLLLWGFVVLIFYLGFVVFIVAFYLFLFLFSKMSVWFISEEQQGLVFRVFFFFVIIGLLSYITI